MGGCGAGALDDVLLLAVIAGRQAGLALDVPDALRDGLAAGHKREDLAVDVAELDAERVEAGVRVVGHAATIPEPRGVAERVATEWSGDAGAAQGARRYVLVTTTWKPRRRYRRLAA